MSRHIILAPRTDQPSRWALVLLALVIIAGVAVLFLWLEGHDSKGQVAGVPAELMRPEREVRTPAREQAPAREEQAPAREERPAPEKELPQVLDLNLLLTAPDKSRLVGRQVVLEDAPVQSLVGNFTFWVGPDARNRVPVVLLGELMMRQPESRVQVEVGQRVRVFGVVRELRDVDALEEARFLSPQERESLRQAGIFISAQRVVTLKP